MPDLNLKKLWGKPRQPTEHMIARANIKSVMATGQHKKVLVKPRATCMGTNTYKHRNDVNVEIL